MTSARYMTSARPTRPTLRRATPGLPLGLLKLVRRGHMYAGLLLAPRVLIYATAALLFNHPGLRGEPKVQPINAQIVSPGGLWTCARSDTACTTALVVASLAVLDQQPDSSSARPRFELVSRDSVTSSSSMSIPARRGGERWHVSVDLAGGITRVTAFPQTPPSWSDILMRLHMSHGYPKSPEADGADAGASGSDRVSRWSWAVMVDALALLLFYWAFSGVTMWWQMRGLRRSGAIVLTVGVLAALWLGFSMTDLIQRNR